MSAAPGCVARRYVERRALSRTCKYHVIGVEPLARTSFNSALIDGGSLMVFTSRAGRRSCERDVGQQPSTGRQQVYNRGRQPTVEGGRREGRAEMEGQRAT
jgi:hypothetical protein